MIKKLKKFFGHSYLSRLKFTKNTSSAGYVELISPNLISGWVLDHKTKFVEVRLIDDNQILASAPIDIFREDVNSKFKYKNATGFNLKLNSNFKKEKILNPKLIAINASAKRVYELKFTFKNERFHDQLKELLNSQFLSCKGKIHRIADNGQLIGWAFNEGNNKEITIWMHSKSNQPIEIKCNLSLYKLPISDFNQDYYELPINCGINFNINNYKNINRGEELTFTFDKNGKYPLESNRRLTIPIHFDSSKSVCISSACENLIKFINSLEDDSKKYDEKKWFPWRVFSLLTGSRNIKNYSEDYFRMYEKKFHNLGTNTLECFNKLDSGILREEIIDFFDFNYYGSYEDLTNFDEESLINHYIKYAEKESNRNPNPIFDTSEFLNLYPWISKIKANPLFLFIKWPEQFPKFRNHILKRYKIISNEPFSREKFSWALHNYSNTENTNFINYKRILYLVNKFSSKERLIKANPNSLNIHFVIPDFSKGGGGHMTIFRLIRNLENLGHNITIWIKDYNFSNHPEGPSVDIKKYFQNINANVFELNTHFAFVSGDAIVATSWDTVEVVKSHNSFIEKFYLVQDYEPLFYPRGSNSLKSEETYKEDLKTICASIWLDKTMREEFNKKSCYFELSYNKEIFNNNFKKIDNTNLKNKDIIRIAFYGRIFTERRAVELALEGMEELVQKNYNICLELFGVEKNIIKIPESIEGIDNGILSPYELAKLYSVCDIGIALSATNYSLVPPEMMASCLPVLELSTESNKLIYPKNVVKFAEASPKDIANAINELIENDNERNLIIKNAYDWVSNSSWEKGFKKVESFIRSEVQESIKNININISKSMYERYKNNLYEEIKITRNENCLVTVVVPTFNGGNLLKECIDKLNIQKVDFNFEILIIDSSSTDNSIEMIENNNNISIYKIKQSDFQHGKTRNLAVALSKGEFVAFLTQDAIPANESWLTNIVNPMIHDLEVCAVFGRHEAHKNHTRLSKESMDSFFNLFSKSSKYRIDNNLKKYFSEHPSYRQHLHYYSDNNSCLRKSTWEKFPYQDVDYGEDQLWADWIIKSNKTKAYSKDAIVNHSHEYNAKQEFERSYTEANYFFKYFGYDLSQSRLEIEQGLQAEAQNFLKKWKLIYKQDKDIDKNLQLDLIRAKREGYKLGVEDAIDEIIMRK